MTEPSQPDEKEPQPPRQPFLASDAWHSYVTWLCLIACAEVVLLGFSLIKKGVAGGRGPAAWGTGAGLMVLGVLACRYLWRQLRKPPSKIPRK
jgi:hypothetical protein